MSQSVMYMTCKHGNLNPIFRIHINKSQAW